jgi:hypothetical protein
MPDRSLASSETFDPLPGRITLFKAPQSLEMADGVATAVVDKIEEHVAVKISEANKGLVTTLDARMQALEAKIDWVLKRS